jgi:signal transduction histidine kinase/ActR/RegA family two-component response regulator
MSEAPPSELGMAARLRLQAVPQRLTAVVAAAAVLHLAFGWPLVWLWVALYAAAIMVEADLGRAYLERMSAGRPAGGGLYVAAMAVVSAIFGSISVPLLLLEHGRDGEVYGLLLLAGGLVNVLIASQSSRAAFLATAGPYGAYLLLNPVLAYGYHVDEMSWVGVLGAAMLLAQTLSSWRRHCGTLRAEAEARREAEALAAQAQAAVAAKSAFVAMVSHELRTPLSGVLAAGSQLRAPKLPPRARREAVEVVVDAGRFMHALLDDLLDLAKLEAGKMTTECVDFDQGHLVWSLERHWAAAARDAGKPLQLTSAMGLPQRVCGDPTRLRQVLNNLLSNAVKFTGPAGVTWAVDVCDTAEGCALTVRVTDTGPGIAPEQLERLFTPFDQTKTSVARTHGGTGLGLAVSRELARAMGGELRVESRLGRGSTFVLSLPLARGAPVEAPVEVEAGAEETARTMRLLVVDDHEINRRTMALLLEAAGAEVTAAESGAEALTLLSAEPFDAVLSDVNMPEMDGLAFTRALRGAPGPNQLAPVIAVTGGDSEAERLACLTAGMSGCVSKPIDPRALYAALDAALATEAEAEARAA